MKKISKYAGQFGSVLLTVCLLTACGGAGQGGTNSPEIASSSERQNNEDSDSAPLTGNIEIATNVSDPTFSAIRSVFDRYMEENPGVTIDFSTQEADYEQLLKARMASNDLPDIFVTHGWSVVRYSEYLRPLNDQPWYDTILESFLPIIENDQGEIFVMPINMDSGGILYNKGLLEELGVGIPQTWEELMTACELGKEKGYIGVFLAGKDSRNPAILMDIAATTFLEMRKEGYREQLLDGSFDWQNWTPVSQFLKGLKSNGYLNPDASTCDPIDLPMRLAENNALFHITLSTELIEQIKAVNPQVEFGFAPIPAFNTEYQPVFCGGEREAYGIWKDTENEEVCLSILEFMARPDNVKTICEASGKLPAIEGAYPDLGSLMNDFNAYESVPVQPVFDRAILPSGMWSTLRTIGSALISDEMTVEESVKVMEEDYNTLRIQAVD